MAQPDTSLPALIRFAERYRSLFENSIDAIYAVDRQGRFTEVNPAGEQLSGYPAAQLLQMTFPEVCAPDQLERTLASFQQQLRGISESLETALIARDGRRVEIFTTGRPLVEAGQIVGMIAIARDITGEKRAAEALRQSEERYRQLTEAIPQMAWHCQPNGALIEANQRWYDYTGQTPEEARGHGWMKALHPDDVARVAERVRDDVRGGEFYQTEYRLRRGSDGSFRWYVARAVPLRDQAGQIVCWFGGAADIDDQKRAAEILRRSHDELEVAVRDRTRELMATVELLQQEVTERKLAEQALRASEDRYRQLFEKEFHAVAVVNPATRRFEQVNAAAVRMFGYTREEFDTLRTDDLSTDPEKTRAHYRELIAAGPGHELIAERTLRRKDGTVFPAEIIGATFLANGQSKVLTTARDITTRKEAEAVLHRAQEQLESQVRERTAALTLANEALRESEERYHLLFESASDGVTMADVATGRVEGANAEALRLYGYARDEYLTLCVEDISGEPEKSQATLQGLLARPPGTEIKFTRRIRRKDGTTFLVEATGRTLVWQGRLKLLAAFRDITERRELERETLEVSNREQRRIGQDLHDGVCQQLTGIGFLAQALADKLKSRSAPGAAEAAEIGRLISQTLVETQNLARGLCPVDLEGHTLVEALQHLAAFVRNLFGVSCLVKFSHPVIVSDAATALHLYRIAQEAVTNGVRHGKAKQFWIDLVRQEDLVVLTVEDDGQGFTPAPGGKGMGLRIMQYRASIIGGDLDIRRNPQTGGMIVSCSLRVKAGAPSARH